MDTHSLLSRTDRIVLARCAFLVITLLSPLLRQLDESSAPHTVSLIYNFYEHESSFGGKLPFFFALPLWLFLSILSICSINQIDDVNWCDGGANVVHRRKKETEIFQRFFALYCLLSNLLHK